LKESVARFGMVQPVIVRCLVPSDLKVDEKGEFEHYEIIDGEHRWRAAVEMGFEEIDVWDLEGCDDATAKALTLALNELRGKPEDRRLAALVSDLIGNHDYTSDLLLSILPWGKPRIDDLLSLLDSPVASGPTPSIDEEGREGLSSSVDEEEVILRFRFFRPEWKEVEGGVALLRDRYGFGEGANDRQNAKLLSAMVRALTSTSTLTTELPSPDGQG